MSKNHFFKFSVTLLKVFSLLSMYLGCDDQLSLLVDAVCFAYLDFLYDLRWYPIAGVEVESDLCFRVNFVDILSSWALRPRIRSLEFRQFERNFFEGSVYLVRELRKLKKWFEPLGNKHLI